MNKKLKNILSSLFPKHSEEYLVDYYKNLLQDIKKHARDKKEYEYTINRLCMFLDSEHSIGKYGDIFRSKFINNKYTPERLVKMETTEFLPEIFMSMIDMDKQKELLDKIERLLHTDTDKETDTIHITSAKRLPEICNTPYWNIDRPNIIICKENGLFYCLDLVKLLESINERDVALNYETGNPISKEIEKNLRIRYKKELDDLSNGKELSFTYIPTEQELDDLTMTLTNLKELYNKIDKKYLSEKGKRAIPLKEYNKYVPIVTRRKFNRLSTEEFSVEFITWLETNIEDIEFRINQLSKPLPIDDEPLEHTIEQKVNEQIENVDIHDSLLKFIEQKVLIDNSIITSLIDNYKNRLDTSKKQVLLNLDKSDKTAEERIVLNECLNEINTILSNLNDSISSFPGLLGLLREKLDRVNDLVDAYSSITLRHVLEPELNSIDIVSLQKEQQQLQNEIMRIEQLELQYNIK